MLTDHASGSQHWLTDYVYNSSGQLTETINPSAASGTVTTGDTNLGITAGSTGLVQGIDYYTSEDGQPSVFDKDTWVQDGSDSGTRAIQSYQTYAEFTAASQSVWLVTENTVYSGINTTVSGTTGVEVTDYTFSFYYGTNQIQMVTINQPGVTDEGDAGGAIVKCYVPDGQKDWLRRRLLGF